MAKWFCLIEDNQVGPIESAKVKQLAEAGTLKPHHKVRREDMAEWHEAREVKGLFAAGQPKPSAASSAVPPKSQKPQPAVGATLPQSSEPSASSGSVPIAKTTPVSGAGKYSSPGQSLAGTTAETASESSARNILSTTKGKALGCGCLLVLFVMLLPAIHASREAARRHSGLQPWTRDSPGGAKQTTKNSRMAPSSGITLDTSKLSEEARKYFLGSEGIAFSADSREDTVDWANSRCDQLKSALRSGNELVTTEIETAIKEEMVRLKGTKVKWELRVTAVSSKKVEFDSDTRSDNSIQIAALDPASATGLGSPWLQIDQTNIERARSLKKDDTALISASVVEVYVERRRYVRVTLSDLAFADDRNDLRDRIDRPDSETKRVKPATALTVDQFRSRIIGRDFMPKTSFYDEYGKPISTRTVGSDTYLVYKCQDGMANVVCPSGPFQYSDDIAPVAVEQIR